LHVIIAGLIFAQNTVATIRGTLRQIDKKVILMTRERKLVTFRRIKKKSLERLEGIREGEFQRRDA